MIDEYVEQRNGGYFVSGTRVSLDSIVYAYRLGESAESIRQNFPSLSLVQVYGAITFYLLNQHTVDAYLREAEKEWDEFARDHPLPEELRQKLERARQEVSARRDATLKPSVPPAAWAQLRKVEATGSSRIET
jgi:uncharacterized protein (DUF433 family)